jgi:hypothetical protein
MGQPLSIPSSGSAAPPGVDPVLLVFSQRLATTGSYHGGLTMRPCPKLGKSLQELWQACGQAQARTLATGQGELLVEYLLQELRQHQTSRIEQHWQSFLQTTALQVANKIARVHNNYQGVTFSLEDTQSICCMAIGTPGEFFGGFRRQQPRSCELLPAMKSYAFSKILYSAYPGIRKEVGDRDLGRKDLGLFNRYGYKRTEQALRSGGLDQDTIEKYLRLQGFVKEYLRHHRQRIHQLTTADFQNIGDEYQKITGDLSPPVEDSLRILGQCLRRFNDPPTISIEPLDGEDSFAIGSTLRSSFPQPEEELEQQSLWEEIDKWFSSDKPSREQIKIFILKYRYQLKQCAIAAILDVDQPRICRKLGQTHVNISKHLLATLNPGSSINPQEILPEVISLLAAKINDLSILRHNPTDSQRLDLLIAQLKISDSEQSSQDLWRSIRATLNTLFG